jgi:hypothetical protein
MVRIADALEVDQPSDDRAFSIVSAEAPTPAPITPEVTLGCAIISSAANVDRQPVEAVSLDLHREETVESRIENLQRRSGWTATRTDEAEGLSQTAAKFHNTYWITIEITSCKSRATGWCWLSFVTIRAQSSASAKGVAIDDNLICVRNYNAPTIAAL